MPSHWTFGKRLTAGFAISVALTVAMSAVAIVALQRVVAGTDRLVRIDARRLVAMQQLQTLFEKRTGALRGYLLIATAEQLENGRAARAEFLSTLDGLRREAVPGDEPLLDQIIRSADAYERSAETAMAKRRADASPQELNDAFEALLPMRREFELDIAALRARGEQRLEDATAASTRAAAAAVQTVGWIALAALAFGTGIAVFLTRALTRQIGSAVGQVQTSSAQLQASANEQALGTKEQATAMNEMTTTMNELLVTSRQIEESARRVAQISEEACEKARSGEQTVTTAQELIGGIRRQVDLVVHHMLELGKKSQQIGSVLDLVSELAEQTNILSINASIEASGAGEAGKRFAVVADEIRKLSDRVSSSAKRIRDHVDEVRSAVNATVMVTETGSKAVDAGTKQFAEVAASFDQIARIVSTSTEAVRQIELSTQQQTSAVEQVNAAIENVAQATRESEVGASQTLQTAGQLSELSRSLLRLIRPGAAA
jgi:methyl-accepting chemotaxis protein